MIALQATVDYSQYGPKAAQILSLLGPEVKKEMHDGAADEVAELLRTHVSKYATTHHATADDIKGGPAERTGHIEEAAASVAKGSITADSAEVTISSPGFRRALGPLTILPKNKPALTVAIRANSYGKTVSDMVAAGVKIFKIKKKATGKEYLATISYGGELLVLYALKQQVTLKHAPEMLPENDEFKAAARAGVVGVLEMLLAKRGAA